MAIDNVERYNPKMINVLKAYNKDGWLPALTYCKPFRPFLSVDHIAEFVYNIVMTQNGGSNNAEYKTERISA